MGTYPDDLVHVLLDDAVHERIRSPEGIVLSNVVIVLPDIACDDPSGTPVMRSFDTFLSEIQSLRPLFIPREK